MNHKDLEVWKSSIALVVEIYNITKSFPEDEKFGIINQMRRAAVSIPSNIAEGSARFSDKETIHFLDVVNGSLAELETQILISKELGYVINEDIISRIDSISKMLNG